MTKDGVSLQCLLDFTKSPFLKQITITQISQLVIFSINGGIQMWLKKKVFFDSWILGNKITCACRNKAIQFILLICFADIFIYFIIKMYK